MCPRVCVAVSIGGIALSALHGPHCRCNPHKLESPVVKLSRMDQEALTSLHRIAELSSLVPVLPSTAGAREIACRCPSAPFASSVL